MMNYVPKRPVTDTPPAPLVHFHNQALENPAIADAGFTTTSEGDWGLLISLRKGVRIPLDELQEIAPGFPIILSEEAEDLPVARPAYPGETTQDLRASIHAFHQ